MDRRLVVICVFITVLLQACGASVPRKVSKDQLAGVKRIAIISIGQERLQQLHVGLTAFGNEEAIHDVSAWKLNQHYAQFVAQAEVLKSFEVSTPEVEPNLLAGLFKRDTMLASKGNCDPEWTLGQQKLQSLAQSLEVDTLLVLAPESRSDYLSNSNQTFCGLGILTRGVGALIAASALHLEAQLAFVDGRTGTVLAARQLGTHMTLKEALTTVERPAWVRTIPWTMSRKPVDTWTQQETDQMIAEANLLVERRSVQATLTKMLTPDE